MRKGGSAQIGLPFGHAAPTDLPADKLGLLIATWNVNSIRARLDVLRKWLREREPDVVLIQETKISDDMFPIEFFSDIGYEVASFGESQRNGVAILSRASLQDATTGPEEFRGEARIIAATVYGIRVANIYVPNAQSIADESFQYKIDWLNRFGRYVNELRSKYPVLLLGGDFNVSPFEFDVHDPAQWLYQTFIHPDVRGALKVAVGEELIDLHVHMNGAIRSYTWWDYRNEAFSRNEGMRIDLFFASRALAGSCNRVWVDTTARGAERPSDHAAVLAQFDFQKLKRSSSS